MHRVLLRQLIVEHDEVCDRAESLGAQLAVMTSDKERLDAEVKFQTETVQELRDLVTRLTVDGEQFQATIASLNDSVARLELQKRDAEEKTEMETRRHEAYKEMRNSEQKKLKVLFIHLLHMERKRILDMRRIKVKEEPSRTA